MTFEEWQIQERMMRIGQEVRFTDMSLVLDYEAKYREIAIKTLKADHGKSELSRKFSTKIKELFAKQLEFGFTSIFFFMMTNEHGKPEIFRTANINELENCKGEIISNSRIPRIDRESYLRRHG